MSVFDLLDAELNREQAVFFGDTMFINGVPITVIVDDVMVYLGEVGQMEKRYTISTTDMPPGFARGQVVVVGDVSYQVTRLYPPDSGNIMFELQRS